MVAFVWLALTSALVTAGCSSGGDETSAPEVPGGADPAKVEVIDRWAMTLRRGDVEGAAELFAIPSLAVNPPIQVTIQDLMDAKLFNRALPCGAKLIRAVERNGAIAATFRLTERPGPGTCGDGTGNTAQTSFVIEDGKIVEWRRVDLGPGQPTAPGTVS